MLLNAYFIIRVVYCECDFMNSQVDRYCVSWIFLSIRDNLLFTLLLYCWFWRAKHAIKSFIGFAIMEMYLICPEEIEVFLVYDI